MGRRHQQLEDSLKLHEFIHDIEDEMAWIREREPLANNTAIGNSLTSVNSLLKKHQVSEYPIKLNLESPFVSYLIMCSCMIMLI